MEVDQAQVSGSVAQLVLVAARQSGEWVGSAGGVERLGIRLGDVAAGSGASRHDRCGEQQAE
jgi:uncharacterized cupin superfamily protein